MRRADRLFQIVQLVRGRRLSTAEFIAQRLEVSARTVYRDIADLQAQGVPIEGEAGVGYRMRAGFDLPPLMFTTAEAQALVAAVRVAQPRLDSVRRAIAHAIDRKAFIDGAQEGLGTPIGSHFAPTDKGYVDLTKAYPYDPDKARALLAADGV